MENLSLREAMSSLKLIIFGGTCEGRELAEFAAREGVRTLLSVASDYGAEQISPQPGLRILEGRLNAAEMRQLFEREKPHLLLDATHPHAYEVSQNIERAAKETGTRLLRTKREQQLIQDAYYFDSPEEALDDLRTEKGRIFSAMGIKSAKALTRLPDYQEKIILRVLPDSRGLRHLEELAYPRKHLIAMQGPFSKELNKAMFEAVNAKILLSKDSGLQGGFLEKVEAAQELGMKIYLIRLPREEGLSVSSVKRMIKEYGHEKD